MRATVLLIAVLLGGCALNDFDTSGNEAKSTTKPVPICQSETVYPGGYTVIEYHPCKPGDKP